MFILKSDFTPSGDQPCAIESLNRGLENREDQVLLGVTGSGKTFTIANVIQQQQKTSLILAPNKTLAAQLYQEMKEFFPENAVEYFVSYYDYYQPEAYVPHKNLYIEKEATINEEIDRLRHSATRSLLERRDTIIIASVSCIYGIGDVETYSQMTLTLNKTISLERDTLIKDLIDRQYTRNDFALQRGCFRVKGDSVDIFPSHCENQIWHLSFFGTEIEKFEARDPLTGEILEKLTTTTLYPNNHYVTPKPTLTQAIQQIKKDLHKRIDYFESEKKHVEAQRINERVSYDIEMLESTHMCPGIENYSRYLSGRDPGEPPPTLFEYLPRDSLLIVDESHIAIPQLRAMYKGDAARKKNLSQFGFRLPACKDNRPLMFEEWERIRPLTIFVSATPGPYELDKTQGVFVDQVIRPTGLLDPECIIRPTTHQVDDILAETHKCIALNMRVLITTLTKKMAESLAKYMDEAGIKAHYIHSDVDTLERIEIIRKLREGTFDVLIGINLLREGLDIPECGLVAILDADKEGYLRSKTALIQTVGRAARNAHGKAILYADVETDSIKGCLYETKRRRQKQQNYNKEHNITPQTIKKKISDSFMLAKTKSPSDIPKSKDAIIQAINSHRRSMLDAAERLEFEKAATHRDALTTLEKALLEI